MMEAIFSMVQYGALGILTAYLLFQENRRYKEGTNRESQLTTIIANNTIAMTKFYEVAAHCPKIKKGINR